MWDIRRATDPQRHPLLSPIPFNKEAPMATGQRGRSPRQHVSRPPFDTRVLEEAQVLQRLSG
jgi:hypothetical protein